ncbi:chemotaxis protein CheW [Aeoliella sp. ICT_H6.2]|uniref:Chemotaxis protein CheW n=1 Tax=Aeoliella straminimaris TaxID=2954799 RepID=A0A9X2FGF0_9BACT|nr:chemotaxis protein CheW [Aeoliella straminimaris]MCO6043801.1 chemotaxis protein CheW [Aeoliella straminimaris]
MTTETSSATFVDSRSLRLATFYVGDMLLGLEIDQVQEINRCLDVTTVPHAPNWVRGVINLRGDVVTVIDLRTVLGLERGTVTKDSRNLIVNLSGELVGLCVDRIADIITVAKDDVIPPPSNISVVDQKFFSGVATIEQDIVAVLNLNEALETSN